MDVKQPYSHTAVEDKPLVNENGFVPSPFYPIEG
jgi:hypothetical protein